MSPLPSLPGLVIESSECDLTSPYAMPVDWPPRPGWPVVFDKHLRVISRWKDPQWVFDLWAGQRCALNFGDGALRKSPPIDKRNANLLRVVVGWWLYGIGGVRTTQTLILRFQLIRPIFQLCSEKGILATELNGAPALIEEIGAKLMPSGGDTILTLLHDLHVFRDQVGVKLLDETGLALLATSLRDHSPSQTEYIPPRIWTYQQARLRECLEDFAAKSEELSCLFNVCLEAYVENYGSLEALEEPGRCSRKNPFRTNGQDAQHSKYRYLGSFRDVARDHGVADLLCKWVEPTLINGVPTLSLDNFSAYLTLLNWVGLGCLLNFSLMRSSEGLALKHDCLHLEDDAQFGRIFLLEGTPAGSAETAYWVTSESASLAVDVLRRVGRLRKQCINPERHEDWLIQMAHEPWSSRHNTHSPGIRPRPVTYLRLQKYFPQLLDIDQLRITDQDLKLAKLATPTLSESFKVGEPWPLAWHQLRRTGAVNMQSSGMVSESSLQFQLKHATRAMTLYYGQNYSRVHLEQTAKTAYVQAMYESIGKELQGLAAARFVSPHGPRRKEELIRLISPTDLKESIRLAKSGGVACRDIALGACMNKDPCPYGGIESVAHCGGGDTDKPCAEVLYDREKAENVDQLDLTLQERLDRAAAGSPLHESLLAQRRSVANYRSVVKVSAAHPNER